MEFNGFGLDIAMAFDECAPYPADYQYTRPVSPAGWAVQGGPPSGGPSPVWHYSGRYVADLRKASADDLVSNFPEYISSLSVGEPKGLMYEMLEVVIPRILSPGTAWGWFSGLSPGGGQPGRGHVRLRLPTRAGTARFPQTVR